MKLVARTPYAAAILAPVRHLALALLLVVAGCSPGHTAVDVKTHLAVSISPSPDVLPFDPASARLVQVQNQLTEVAGHTVQLVVDAALVPDFRGDFEEALDVALENVVRDLGQLRAKEPAAFAYAVPLLTRVEARYDAASSVFEARLDLEARGPARLHGLFRTWDNGKGRLQNNLPKVINGAVIATHLFRMPTGEIFITPILHIPDGNITYLKGWLI